jgi:hypothetical protein
MKMILVVTFFYFYQYTVTRLSKDAKVFYSQFVPIGLMYLLSDPIMILSCYTLHEYNR